MYYFVVALGKISVGPAFLAASPTACWCALCTHVTCKPGVNLVMSEDVFNALDFKESG